MLTPLRVLILEDCEADAVLLLHQLRQAGFDPAWQRVEDEPGFLALLDPPPGARSRQPALEALSRSVRQLSRLGDDLLEATRVSQGRIRLRLDRVDLARLARTAAEDRRPLFERAGLRLAVQAPETPVWVT